MANKEVIEREGLFKININPLIPKIIYPEDKTLMDITYPLIEPYVTVRIYWDNNLKELIYKIQEPELDDNEKTVLNLIEEGFKELINVSLVNIKNENVVLEYLEKTAKILLTELRIKISSDSFLKIMYYIYRDFVGLNELEPLMRDPFIEDIECNGIDTPVYIVHRKLKNIKTNLIFTSVPYLASLVEKLAQKCGKYVSYANPLLDGSMPDGSRINSTYTQDISTKGPTITIRKFTKEPWTPIKLMKNETVSPEMLAYLWILLENESNIMVIGGTGSGKCVTGDTKIYLSNGKIRTIKEIVEEKFNKNKSKIVTTDEGWEYLEADLDILMMDTNDLKIKKGVATRLWLHKAPSKLVKITTRSGRSVTVTAEHPFFTTKDLELVKIRADTLKLYDRIAIPRNIEIKGSCKIDLMKKIVNERDVYVFGICKEIDDIVHQITKKYDLNKKSLAKKLNICYTTLRCWAKNNAIPLFYYNRLSNLIGLKLNKDILLKSKTTSRYLKLPEINPELFRFIALVIADGHLTRTNVQFNNTNGTLLNNFLYLGKRLFGINGKIEYPKDRTTKVVIYSSMLAKILNKVFNIPYGNKARSVVVPEVLFQEDDKSISQFLQGIVDCESYVGKTEIEVSTTSKDLATGMNTLFLRLGILPRLIKRKNHLRIYISGFSNVKQFSEKVGYLHPKKIASINKLLNRKMARAISNVDLIPNASGFLKSFRLKEGITQNEFTKCLGISPRLLRMWESGFRQPSIYTFNKLNEFIEINGYFEDNPDYFKINTFAESDIFWDEVSKIEVLRDHGEKYVYDLTVPEHHNFLAGDIPIIVHNTSFLNAIAFFVPPPARIVSIEDTHELQLMHENWLPNVTREIAGGFGGPTRLGEVTLFDLLKESFRQRPDYVIVGEIRGAESYVLFQGMASIKGDEKIMVLNSENPKNISIENLKNNVKYKAFCIDLNENKAEIMPVRYNIKHSPRNLLLNIKTKSGREVTITDDHSLFTYDGGIIPIRGDELKMGDIVIIPSKIPCSYADLDYINLIEFLPDIRVFAPNYIRKAVSIFGYDNSCKIIGFKAVSDYYANFTKNKQSSLEANRFLKLMKKAEINYNLDKITVKFLRKSKSYPAKLKITEEFLKLLGYYLSGGGINDSGKNSTISLYNKNKKILKDMKHCIKTVVDDNIRERITDRGFGSATELSFTHKVLFEFIKEYCGKGSKNKKIPDFIFGLNKEKIGWFLTGLYNGDGWITKNHIGYSSISKQLIDGLAKLLLVYEIVGRIRKCKQKNRKNSDYRILFYKTNYMMEFLKYVRLIRKKVKLREMYRPDFYRKGDIYLDKVVSIKKINLKKPQPVYDLSVPGVQNFIGGFGGILLHNSGHSCMGTMHAEDVETMIRRLETQPINLSPSLVDSLDVVCVMAQVKVKGEPKRKLVTINEILKITEEKGKAITNTPFVWNPATNKFLFKFDMKILDKIILQKGIPKDQLMNEFKIRVKLLSEMSKRNIIEIDEVYRVINEYYKNPEGILRRFGIK
ncbi:Flp pilus assembly complex ATPase component TadA [Candidatus Woesearchaeota archaeon]|nr:Flp pilus assembly complex ATPase component TadA [Candidatus Woesearchaeota archaeon]